MPYAHPSTSPIPALCGRLMLATIFLVSGIGKLADPSGTISYIESSGLPLPQVAYALALAIELGGSALLVLGYRTRAVALAMALFTVATAIEFHSDFRSQNQLFHFLKNLAVAGGLLQVFAFGAGALSIDGRQRAPRS